MLNICSECGFVDVCVFKPELLVKFAPELDAALRYLLWHVSTEFYNILFCIACTWLVKVTCKVHCVMLLTVVYVSALTLLVG